jgi:hypothetical protein
MPQTLNFATINSAALSALTILCARWIPGGKRIGREYVPRPPQGFDFYDVLRGRAFCHVEDAA